jgi:biotin carboxyl carrier protein
VAQQDLEQKVVVAEAKVREAETKAQVAETKAREAEAKAVAAEAKAQAAVTAPKPAATPAKKEPSWLAALVTLDRAAAKPDKAEPLESRLVGDFRGWSGQTVFTLENGTRWVQQNKVDHYDYSPALHAPLVKIKPSSVSGFWLEVKGVNSRVRVIPLSLPD